MSITHGPVEIEGSAQPFSPRTAVSFHPSRKPRRGRSQVPNRTNRNARTRWGAPWRGRSRTEATGLGIFMVSNALAQANLESRHRSPSGAICLWIYQRVDIGPCGGLAVPSEYQLPRATPSIATSDDKRQKRYIELPGLSFRDMA